MNNRTYESLGELRDVVRQLARASNHNVYIDVGDSYQSNIGGTEREDLNYGVAADKQAIWNDRDNALAYIGSDNYTITQHADVIGTISRALEKSVGGVGTGCIRDHGERIDGFATLDGHSIDVMDLVGDDYMPPARADMADPTITDQDAKDSDGWKEDRIGVGVRFQNSFDGSERLVLETMGYRYIPQTWLLWGSEEIGSQKMLHVRHLKQEDVEDLIYEVMEEKETVEDAIIESAEDGMPIEAVPELLESAGYGVTYQKKITRTLQSFGPGNYVSRWDVYNAIAQYLDHEVAGDVSPETYNRWQEAAADVFTGRLPDPEPVDEFEAVFSR